jgi:hypothetical protein
VLSLGEEIKEARSDTLGSYNDDLDYLSVHAAKRLVVNAMKIFNKTQNIGGLFEAFREAMDMNEHKRQAKRQADVGAFAVWAGSVAQVISAAAQFMPGSATAQAPASNQAPRIHLTFYGCHC